MFDESSKVDELEEEGDLSKVTELDKEGYCLVSQVEMMMKKKKNLLHVHMVLICVSSCNHSRNNFRI